MVKEIICGLRTKKLKLYINNILKEFPSLRNVALNEGIFHSCIGESIRLGTKANSYKWKYKDGN